MGRNSTQTCDWVLKRRQWHVVVVIHACIWHFLVACAWFCFGAENYMLPFLNVHFSCFSLHTDWYLPSIYIPIQSTAPGAIIHLWLPWTDLFSPGTLVVSLAILLHEISRWVICNHGFICSNGNGNGDAEETASLVQTWCKPVCLCFGA